MQLTYRGQQYTANSAVSELSNRLCYYRGAAYNPAKQERQPESAATLIYRGVEYKRPATNQLARIRSAQQKKSRLQAAQYALARR